MKRVPLLLFSGLGILVSCLVSGASAQSIQPGTQVKVRLVENLDTGDAKEGQSFSATLAEPVSLGDKKILARGTRVNGMVTEAVSSGRLKRPASITLALTSVEKTPITTEGLQIDGKSHVVHNSALIGGGAASGAVLGAIAGGGKGAAIGTAAGASVGAGTAYVTGKQEIVLPPETELTFVIAETRPTAATAPEQVVERNSMPAPESRPAIWHGDMQHDGDDAYDNLIFSDRDIWLIRSYFQSNYGNLPLALAKRGGDLPPGLEKHITRDETLAPGLQKRVAPLPAELQRRLPGLPFGYSRVFLLGRVLNLSDDGQIVDVMSVYN
jgi:hypothetical protein